MKYSAYAECEIIHFVNCEISPFGRCEMKFASSHLRSKYFTAELFHMAKPYFTRRRRISLKKAHIVLVDKCVLFSGGGVRTRFSRELRARSSTGSDSPPDCHSPPFPLLVLPPIKTKRSVHIAYRSSCFGGGVRTRTLDMRFWRPPFYQLNYTPGCNIGIITHLFRKSKSFSKNTFLFLHKRHLYRSFLSAAQVYLIKMI